MYHFNYKALLLKIISWALSLQHTKSSRTVQQNITSYIHMTFNWYSQRALTLCREGKCGKWTFWEACSTFHAYSLNARQLKMFTLQAITAKTCLLRFWNWSPFISLLYNFTPSLNGLLSEKFTLKGSKAQRLCCKHKLQVIHLCNIPA